jgi:hypothetical protein
MTAGRWWVYAVIAILLALSLAAISSIPGLKNPVEAWLILTCSATQIAVAYWRSMECPREKALIASPALLGAAWLMQLYTHLAHARTSAVIAIEWISIAMMFGGVVFLYVARPNGHRK